MVFKASVSVASAQNRVNGIDFNLQLFGGVGRRNTLIVYVREYITAKNSDAHAHAHTHTRQKAVKSKVSKPTVGRREGKDSAHTQLSAVLYVYLR